MALYAKLRGRLTECDERGADLANYLGISPGALSSRMTGKVQWPIGEAYKALTFLDVSPERIFEYFPPDGKPIF